MNVTRTFLVLAMSLSAIFTSNQTAKADGFDRIAKSVGRHINLNLNAKGGRQRPSFGLEIGPGQGFRPPIVRPPQICPPQICPPVIRPPVCPPVYRYKYCVYYYDCHHGWKLYRCSYSYRQAQSQLQHLQVRGYRAYLRKIRVGGGYPGGGYPGGGYPGGGYPGGGNPVPGGPVVFKR